MGQATSFNSDISEWNVAKVTTMHSMFYKATSFNSDISKWNVAKVTNMISMFDGASSFSQTLCGAWKSSTADKSSMFDGSKGKFCFVFKPDNDNLTYRAFVYCKNKSNGL